MKGRTYRHVDQDRRYWRRRGNLKVRKARLTRKSFRWIGLLLFNGLLAWAVWAACSRAVEAICDLPEFRLSRVGLEGLHQASRTDLEQGLARFGGMSLLTLDLDQVAAVVESDPWVEHAAVKRVLPCGLRIRVRERVPAARFRDGDRWFVVDRTGFVHDIARLSRPEAFQALPALTGLAGTAGEDRSRRIRTGLRALGTLQEHYPDWAARVAVIDLAERDRITITSANSGVRLLLDPADVLKNFDYFLALRDQIHDRVGPVRYFDLRWKDRIALMPGTS